MTRQEALNVLGIDDPEESTDAFEELLFEIKQYFLTKPVVSKLFLAQLTKIDRLYEAAEVLGVEISSEKAPISDMKVHFEGVVLNDYLLYEKARAHFKQVLLKTIDRAEIKSIIHQLLEVQQAFLTLWPKISDDNVVIGKEPDPMELLASIKEVNESGVYRFDQLDLSLNAIPAILLNEWKRLSLLSKKELEWKMSSRN